MTSKILLRLTFALCASLAVCAPIPEIGLKENLVREWKDFVEGRRTLEALVEPQFGTAPASGAGRNAVLLPVNFTGTDFERACWDLPVQFDMTRAKGLAFDFYCADLSCFTSFSLYLHADGRWLHGRFSPGNDGAWNRIEILKTAFKEDDSNSRSRGCVHIDRIRISGWRMKDADTTCALANLAVIPVDPDVLVLRGVSSARDSQGESDYIRYAENIEKTLRELDMEFISVNDRELTPRMLEDISVVAVAFSTSLPPEALPVLKDFVRGGGKVVAFYTAPDGVKELIGVTQGAWIKDPAGNFSGFTRRGDGVAYQPDFAPNGSWNANVYAPDPGRGDGRVVAVWRDSQGQDTGHAAIVVTGTGAMFGHVWLAESDPRGADLMMSVLGHLVPALWERRAIKAADRIGRFDDIGDFKAFSEFIEKQAPGEDSRRLYGRSVELRRKAMEALERKEWAASCAASREAAVLAEKTRCSLYKPVKGEHRAFWCHSAFGLQDRNWDDSIRFLKEHGFNVIIPNMSWGATAYYPSAVLPVHASVQERGDQIGLCLAACRKHGVECHVWKVCWNTGHRMSKELEKQFRAEGRIQVSDSGSSDDPWLCPSHPENQRMEIEAQLEVVRNYDVDGVHFDYIRYPGSHYCYCAGCRGRFEKSIGAEVKEWPREVLKGGPLNEDYLEFRRANITRVVREVAERAPKIRQGVEISAAVFRNAPSDRDTIGQDWQLWCREGWLDFVCPMDYIDSVRAFQNVVVQQKQSVGDVPLYPGIGLSVWKDETSHPLKLSRQITVVREAGLKGFTVFNFDARAEHALPYVSLGVTKP